MLFCHSSQVWSRYCLLSALENLFTHCSLSTAPATIHFQPPRGRQWNSITPTPLLYLVNLTAILAQMIGSFDEAEAVGSPSLSQTHPVRNHFCRRKSKQKFLPVPLPNVFSFCDGNLWAQSYLQCIVMNRSIRNARCSIRSWLRWLSTAKEEGAALEEMLFAVIVS